MEFYDTPLREFEYVNLTYDLIISASCYAQLKRHRMATLTAQKYDPELGVTVPPSIEDIGSKKEFMEMMEESNHVYSLLKENMDQGAEYVLTNAHRRRVLLKVSARGIVSYLQVERGCHCPVGYSENSWSDVRVGKRSYASDLPYYRR